MTLQEGLITVGCADETVVINVRGAGTHLNSYSLEAFLTTMLEESAGHFIINLAECSQLDSTFIGVMVGLCQRLGEAGKAKLRIANASSANLLLLRRLGLNHLVALEQCAIPALEAPTDLAIVELSKLDRGRHMLDAHCRLSGLSANNRERFSELIKTLKANIRRHEREAADAAHRNSRGTSGDSGSAAPR